MPRFSGRLRELNQYIQRTWRSDNLSSDLLSAQNMVAVAYERWSFTRGSNYRALTGKRLLFWIVGRLWEDEVVTYER